MDKRNFRKTGTISKVNKKTGELTIIFAGKRSEFELHSEVIFLEIDGGLVPFFVAEEGPISPEYFRVTLEGYNDPEVAQRFVGCKVFLPSDENNQPAGVDGVDLDALRGFEVFDEKYGLLGEVAAVIESPEQVLLQVFRDDTEILIPFTEAFLLGFDMEKKIISLDLPDGLVDLYLDK
jgi:16S rRNA processing protein RimM